MVFVPLQDLRQDGKRRIVHDYLALAVFLVLIVSARIKRPHEVLPVQAEFLRHPAGYDVIHVLRRVTVVRGLFGFELLQEIVILFVPFLPCLSIFLLPLEPLVIEVKSELRHVDVLDLRQLLLQVVHFPVALVELVVGKAQGRHLLFRQVFRPYARHGLHLQLHGRLVPSVADDDHPVFVQDDRLTEPELADAVRDLLDLPSRVRFCVPLVRSYLFDFHFLNIHGISPSVSLSI